MFGIYEQQALPSFNRSLYANEDRMIMWTKNNEWIIKSNDKIYAKISKNDTCPDFSYSKNWRVNMHGQWKNDIGLRIKAKSETCTAGMRLLIYLWSYIFYAWVFFVFHFIFASWTYIVDCHWKQWSKWENCTNPCGRKKRTRVIQIYARFDGNKCKGESEQFEECYDEELCVSKSVSSGVLIIALAIVGLIFLIVIFGVAFCIRRFQSQSTNYEEYQLGQMTSTSGSTVYDPIKQKELAFMKLARISGADILPRFQKSQLEIGKFLGPYLIEIS